jgi:putative Holliday junction resolvase
MRVLGLDLGRRRIGLALSDPKGVLAFPAGALERRNLASDLEALRSLAAERGVERIVVGLPIHMNGRVGAEAEAALSFARALAGATGLPVDTLDERWTTVEAERALRATGDRSRRRRGVVDSVAAAILLRTYLARLANEAEREGSAGS